MSFHQLAYYIVFSTKCRQRIIRNDIKQRVYGYASKIIKQQKGQVIEIGGVEDHVHILAKLSPVLAIADVVRQTKASTSKHVNTLELVAGKFQWQTGYAVFSVSHSDVGSVQWYVRNQETHHRKSTFREEFVQLLERHGVEYDSQYLFETEHSG
jgi:REP element-mobilizing transposase RayT